MTEKRRQAEHALQKAGDELKMKVKERTAELSRSNRNLKQEIEERKQAEERTEHINRILHAIRDVNQLIFKINEPRDLIQRICRTLVENRGYFNAWIGLFDDKKEFIIAAEAGLNKDFSLMMDQLKKGALAHCARNVLERPGVQVVEDPKTTCAGCPLADNYAGRSGIRIRLEYGGHVYGILTASISRELAKDEEEQDLFEELAGDIGLALHSIEIEKKQREIEEKLKDSEERFRTLFELAPDAYFMLNSQGNFIDINKTAEDLSGHTREALIGKNFMEADLLPPDQVSQAAKLFDKNLQRQATKPAEFTLNRKDGSQIHVEISAVPVKIKDQDVILGIARDITERKRKEEEARKLEEQFRQAQKMEAIGRLTGGIAHDFNNLLTVVIGNAELSLMDLDRDHPLCEEIEEIRKAGQTAASLTRQLLAFSRKQIMKTEVLNLNTLIMNLEKMLIRMIGEDVELETLLAPDLGEVEVDAGQIEQVIMNLAVNARDAMPEGGKFIMETANIELDGNYFRNHGLEAHPGHYVMLAASDTGTGMDRETQSHIFAPFFTTKELGHGTGLGLSTVYGIIKQFNGHVWVYSEPGQGTTFKIYLPLIRGQATSFQKEQVSPHTFKGSETVLIVEDSDILRSLTGKILRMQGYRILEAQNGKEAMKIVREHEGRIHLLLTDVVMPGMSGQKLEKHIHAFQPEIKVLFMSGYTDNAIVRHGILKNDIDFIQKPFTPEGMARKVREVLDQGLKLDT